MGYDNELSDAVVLDLETVAAPQCETFLDPVRAPSTYKDPAKIASYCAEKLTERVEKAGLEPDLCEIVAVGWRHPEKEGTATVYTRADVDEAGLLEMTWEAIHGRRIVGFNIFSFDLPVLIRRSQLLGLRVPSVNLDRYRSPHIDLLERLTFQGKLTYRSLAFYTRRFGVPCVDETSGKDIAQMVAASDWEGVRSHCRSDIDKTTALAHRLGWLTDLVPAKAGAEVAEVL